MSAPIFPRRPGPWALSPYFTFDQPIIRYSDGAVPPPGWTFSDIADMEQKMTIFTKKCGYGFRLKTKSDKIRRYVCQYDRSSCRVCWRAKLIDIESFEPGKTRQVWRICEDQHQSHEKHSPRKPTRVDTHIPVDIVWLGIPDGLAGHCSLAIPFITNNRNSVITSERDLQLLEAIRDIRDAVGQDFIYQEEDQTTWVFEPLVTTLLATHKQSPLKLIKTLT